MKVNILLNSWTSYDTSIRDGNSRMVDSTHIEFTDILPRLGDWIPGEDRGEVVVASCSCTADRADMADMANLKL